MISRNNQNTSPTNQKTAGSKLEQSEASEKLFKQLFDVNRFTGMPSHIPGEKSGI